MSEFKDVKEAEIKRKPGFKKGETVLIYNKGNFIRGTIVQYNIKQSRRVYTVITESGTTLLYLPVDEKHLNTYINSKLSKIYSNNQIVEQDI